MRNKNLVFGIQPTGGRLILGINQYFSNTHLHISGEARDNYTDNHKLQLSDHELINKWFEYLWIGNSIASVKYEVVDVIWSSEIKNMFVLVCKAPKVSNDVRLGNSHVFLCPMVDAFFDVDSKWLKNNGFTLDGIKWNKENHETIVQQNYDEKLGW